MTDFSESGFDAPETPDADGFGASDDFFADVGNAFMESVDSIELGEDGSLDMRVREPEPEPAAPQGADPASSADSPSQPGSGQPDAKVEFLENQYKEVQGWATRVSQENADLKTELAELRGLVQGRMDRATPPAAEGAEPESNLDPETEQMLSAYMERNLDQVLSQKLGVPVDKIGEIIQRAAINQDLQMAFAAHDDLQDYLPTMETLANKYPHLGIEQLYDLAKTFGQPASVSPQPNTAERVEAPQTPAPQGTTVPAAPQPPQPQPSQADLAARAQQVSTLTSASAEDAYVPERVIKTPLDAAQAALEDMGR